MHVAPSHPLEGSHDIKSLDHEWPGDGDHMHGMSLEVELAPLTRANEVDGVSNVSWPVETLSKSIFDEGPWHHVVAASP